MTASDGGDGEGGGRGGGRGRVGGRDRGRGRGRGGRGRVEGSVDAAAVGTQHPRTRRRRGGETRGSEIPGGEAGEPSQPAPANELRASSLPFVPRTLPPAPVAPAGASSSGVPPTAAEADEKSKHQRRKPAKSKPAKPKPHDPTDAASRLDAGGTPRGRGDGGGRPDGWWRESTACDPITLEPLADLDHPPFELSAGEKPKPNKGRGRGKPSSDTPATVSHLFDAAVLAEYVTKSKQFENPLNRAPMDAGDCRRLDAHLKRHGLGAFGVHAAFVAAAAERRRAAEEREARANETAAEAAARREAMQSELAESLFMSLRARGARAAARAGTTSGGGGGGGGGERRRRGAAFAHEGALAMVDDDEGMRGRTLGRSSDGDGWRWEDDSHLREPAEDFPALGGGRGGSSGPAPRFAPGVGASAPPAPSAEAAFPALPGGGGFLWSAMASTASSLPAPTSRRPVRVQAEPRPGASSSAPSSAPAPDLDALPTAPAAPAEDDPAAARRRQLADAFGVSDPDRRPSAFAASAAEAFTREVFATAKAHPAEVAAMEHALERLCVDTSKRRISLEPMPRRLRAVAHALGKTYGAASCSYGEEPYCRVDYFRSDATGFPSIRLSDAILADRRDGSDSGAGSDSVAGSRAATATLGGDDFLPEGARPARLGPSPGDPWFEGFTEHYSRRRWRRLEMRFTDFDHLEAVTGALREFSGEYALQLLAPRGAGASSGSAGSVVGRWSPGDDVVAHFWRRAAFDQAVGKIGGGVRGRFRARAEVESGPSPAPGDETVASSAAAAAAAARAEAAEKAAAISGGRTGPRIPGAFGKRGGADGRGEGSDAPAEGPPDWDDI